MHRTLIASAVLATLLLGACSTTKPPPQSLVDARGTLRSAELDPGVLALAPLELKKATASLTRANQLQEAGEPVVLIDSAAHIASQQAKTAMAVAQAKGNERDIAGAELDRERARADSRTAEANRAQAQASTARAQAGDARQQAASAEQRATGAEQRASGAAAQVAAANATANDAMAQSAQLQQELSDLKAQQTDRGTLVTLGDVLFEFGRADIKPGAQASLQKLAGFLQKYPTRRVLIEGHTDSVGSVAANNSLSRRRADAVDSALEGMGVARGRVATVGYGEDYPVATNTSDTNRALNRRVEVYIATNDQAVRQRR